MCACVCVRARVCVCVCARMHANLQAERPLQSMSPDVTMATTADELTVRGLSRRKELAKKFAGT